MVIPVGNWNYSGLQLKHCRHALHGLHPVVADILSMGMDVDEPRSNHMAGGINGFLAADLVLCNDGNGAVFDADVGDIIV